MKTLTYNQSEKQRTARFTAAVYFNQKSNGDRFTLEEQKRKENFRKFHSDKYDTRVSDTGVLVRDEEYSFNRLQDMITKQFYGKYTTAIIYDNKTNIAVKKFVGRLIRPCHSFRFIKQTTGATYFELVIDANHLN
jgi:hypothetical protein